MSGNYALWNLIAPSRWLFWGSLLLLACLLKPGGRWARPLALALVLGWIAMAVMPLGPWLLRPLENRLRPAFPPQAPTDIVVLTGGEALAASRRAGRLEVGEGADRLMEAAALARRYPAARLWIVGGVRLAADQPSDADWVAQWWRRIGLEPHRLHVVNGTADTCGNAAGLKKNRMGEAPLLVTSAFHIPRAIVCMKAAGLTMSVWPVDYRGEDGPGFHPLKNLEKVDLAAHEYLGLWIYYLSGRTERLWPAKAD